ncbi:hypothetical protein FPSE_00355 [Fusarium pseudograminearum CS3096]|uniref:Uncharacterized protein n=1 Tax=Fusarium pseudograminearum (strain CS3096) TaxID=1028729 RepID=K3VUX0_FUSPC|nr:hypothetical protein FPSE_00355 [Fusarium pseudograminearum CS3096]EKJ79424.1 hypothetical protein FPSE_00355 [Fusarium pseudograminearum CS3096]
MTLDRTDMERLRADLIERSRMERGGNPNEGVVNANANANANVDIDVEAGQRQPSMSESRSNIAPLSRLLGRGQPASMTGQSQLPETESVKSQDSNSNRLGAGRRFAVPNFLRIWGRNSNPSQPDDIRNTTASPSPLLPITEPLSPTRPEPVATPSSQSQQSRRQRRQQSTSSAPLEAHLSELLGGPIDRPRRRREHHEGGHRSRRSREQHPKYFMGCIPWVRSRRMRAQILRCMTSGLFLIILVTVYLCLSMTSKVNTREMNIMLILVILFAAAFFFHGLIRLCLLIIKGNREAALRANRPPRYRGPRYAVPPVPIPVVLAQDEEAVGGDSEAAKTMPPAYGRWRETVRVDPNRLFWQRNENVDISQLRPTTRSGPRPPSYASEDGISYVVEAQPRSTAPTTDVPLPIHPSEMGRSKRHLNTQSPMKGIVDLSVYEYPRPCNHILASFT